MRTYYGAKAILKNNIIIGADFGSPESFSLYGEMDDGTKVYVDQNNEQYTRTKLGCKFIFVHV